MIALLEGLIKGLDRRDRARVGLMLLFRLLLIGLDLLGLAFLAACVAIVSGTKTDSSSITGQLLLFFSRFYDFDSVYLAFGVTSLLFFVFKAIISIYLNYSLAQFVSTIETTRTTKIFVNILHSPLEKLQAWSPQKIAYSLHSAADMVFGKTIIAFTIIFGEISLIVAVSIYLYFVNWLLFLFLCMFFLTVGVFLYALIDLRTRRASENYEHAQTKSMTSVFDALASIRVIAALGRQEQFSVVFTKYRDQLSKAAAQFNLLSTLPRYIVETFLILGLVALLFLIDFFPGELTSPTTLALFIAGAFRIVASMLPLQGALSLLRQIAKTSSGVLDLEDSFEDNSGWVDKEILGTRVLQKPTINVKNMKFKYSNSTATTLQVDNLTIPFGAMISLTGRSGSGKSTFADLLLGNLEPTSGEIAIGSTTPRILRNSTPGYIAYVPQDTFLLDGTFAHNITLGFRLNKSKLMEILQALDLTGLLNSLPRGLETMLGDSGIQISGGEKQRIGLARALYRNPKILVLDEVTSALDSYTRDNVMKHLHNLREKMTILLITHDKEVVSKCELKLALKGKKITSSLS